MLKEHFGEKIIYTEMDGKPNVVTIRITARMVLQDYYVTQKMKQTQTKRRASLWRQQQSSSNKVSKTSSYLMNFTQIRMTSPDAAVRILPDTLCLLLEELVVGTKTQAKVAAIRQALMQATRPRVMLAPLQFGLGVQLSHHFSSQFLIDPLHNLVMELTFLTYQHSLSNMSTITSAHLMGLVHSMVWGWLPPLLLESHWGRQSSRWRLLPWMLQLLLEFLLGTTEKLGATSQK